MNSSNVTMFEAKLEMYLYPHIIKILQRLPRYEESTELFNLAPINIEEEDGTMAWFPLGTIFQCDLCILCFLLHLLCHEIFH